MTEGRQPESASSAPRWLAWCRANRHFLVAAVILGGTAAGWNALVAGVGWAMIKYAVPWPGRVQVNEKFRMTALPERIGPYVWAREGTGKDGEIELSQDAMELLKIGTFADEQNRPARQSNWMTIRLYRDTRLPARHPMRYWRLEVYYYTGGVDLVPHVPEICAVAGGAIHLRTDGFRVPVPQAAPDPWGGREVEFSRALFEKTGLSGLSATQFVQYYVFSLNGLPQSSRNTVRLKLASPFVRHAYFAKIQFAPAPVEALPDPAETDGPARQFAGHFLPAVLDALPTAQDVARLDARK